jgi:hypothetical protein
MWRQEVLIFLYQMLYNMVYLLMETHTYIEQEEQQEPIEKVKL